MPQHLLMIRLYQLVHQLEHKLIVYANNVGIETVADSILDFTEGNPFSEGTGY